MNFRGGERRNINIKVFSELHTLPLSLFLLSFTSDYRVHFFISRLIIISILYIYDSLSVRILFQKSPVDSRCVLILLIPPSVTCAVSKKLLKIN